MDSLFIIYIINFVLPPNPIIDFAPPYLQTSIIILSFQQKLNNGQSI